MHEREDYGGGDSGKEKGRGGEAGEEKGEEEGYSCAIERGLKTANRACSLSTFSFPVSFLGISVIFKGMMAKV